MLEPNLGFYICGGTRFPNKIAACVHAKHTGQEVRWWFHDETFDRYPWHIEPPESLDQLYDRRARELREKYDYLILCYSGGSDSHNMIQSFVRQGLHVDEVITNHLTKATKKNLIIDPTVKSNWNFNAEHELQAMPRLRELRSQMPNTKFTVIDISDFVINSLLEFDDVHWVLKRSDHLSVGQAFRYNLFYFSDMLKRFDRGQKVAIVMGVEKPKTVIDSDGMFQIMFGDSWTNITTTQEFNDDYPNVRNELFYWSDTTAPLVAKQAHVIYRWLHENPRRLAAWTKLSLDFHLSRNALEPTLRKLLYSTWDSSWFQTAKATQYVNVEYDRWFHTNPEFARQRLLWQRGIDYLCKIIPEYMRTDLSGAPVNMIAFKHYYNIARLKMLSPSV